GSHVGGFCQDPAGSCPLTPPTSRPFQGEACFLLDHRTTIHPDGGFCLRIFQEKVVKERLAGWTPRAAQNKKKPGSRLPAAASCLGRHAHPAGRSPNRASLLLPLAAVIPPSPEKVSAKQKIQYPVRILDFLVGAGGYREPRI
ncbi:MAG: hypothetical protein ACLS4Y_01605, partial [Faecalibacterium sp.]